MILDNFTFFFPSIKSGERFFILREKIYLFCHFNFAEITKENSQTPSYIMSNKMYSFLLFHQSDNVCLKHLFGRDCFLKTSKYQFHIFSVMANILSAKMLSNIIFPSNIFWMLECNYNCLNILVLNKNILDKRNMNF